MGWVMPLALPASSGVYKNVFALADAPNYSTPTGTGVSLYRSGAANTTRWNLGTWTSDNTGGVLPVVNTWYHLALVIDGTSVKRLYENGILIVDASVANEVATELRLGCFVSPEDANSAANFQLEHFKYFNEALTIAEIMEEMYRAAPVKAGGMSVFTRHHGDWFEESGTRREFVATGTAFTTADGPPNVYDDGPDYPGKAFEESSGLTGNAPRMMHQVRMRRVA